jgi:hypothetical protein
MTNTIQVYDAISPLVKNIPKDVPAIAYYLNGNFAWTQDQVNSFPDALKTTISVKVGQIADWLDVESGDAKPQDAATWEGTGIYCDRANWPLVKQYAPPRMLYWIAIPGATGLIPGATAVQYYYPGPYDISYFDQTFFKLGPPIVSPTKDSEMNYVVTCPNKPDLFITGNAAVVITEVDDLSSNPQWLESIFPWPVSALTYSNFEKLIQS